MKGILGKPRFKREDLVSFTVEINHETKTLNGDIYVVDPMGTLEQSEEPSYDIEAFYDGEILLFKHIRESLVTERNE